MQHRPFRFRPVGVTRRAVALPVFAETSLPGEDRATHRRAVGVVRPTVALRLIRGPLGSRSARFSDFPPSLQAPRVHLAGRFRAQHALHLANDPPGALSP